MQQQDVWQFPPRFLTGIATLPDGLLKLDIAMVYLVSTFAVTATGAVILAASAEFTAQREATRVAAKEGEGAPEEEMETLWDLGLFIFHNACPPLAERLAALHPPTSSAWRGAATLDDAELVRGLQQAAASRRSSNTAPRPARVET